jgi:ATPase, YjeE family
MTIEVRELAELERAAMQVVHAIGDRKVVALYGQMGAGKTSLVQQICKVLDVKDVVSSPTFSLVNEYLLPDGSPIYHFDFYRINKLEEAFDFGYEEYFFSGHLCLVEWPEIIEELIPEDAVKLHITVQQSGVREIVIN